ncbi:MAG: ROK family protein [Acidimicrobiales bacterium]
MSGLIGAIEAGGTKTVAALGSSFEEIAGAHELIVPSTSPRETVNHIFDSFDDQRGGAPLAAIGIGTFGPVDLASGRISMSTPKIAWRGFSWHEAIKERWGDVAVALDTDVNAAGIAEWRWGASRERAVSVYITVGTGIGGALAVGGQPLHGLSHPEFGHMCVPRVRGDDFSGVCLSHGDCLEGLASGVAIEERWGIDGSQLPLSHPAWELESEYLASAVANVVAIGSPQIVVLGGGVMSREGLIEKVRHTTRTRIGDYFTSRELNEDIDSFLVPPALGARAGVLGAFALGLDAASRPR